MLRKVGPWQHEIQAVNSRMSYFQITARQESQAKTAKLRVNVGNALILGLQKRRFQKFSKLQELYSVKVFLHCTCVDGGHQINKIENKDRCFC